MDDKGRFEVPCVEMSFKKAPFLTGAKFYQNDIMEVDPADFCDDHKSLSYLSINFDNIPKSGDLELDSSMGIVNFYINLIKYNHIVEEGTLHNYNHLATNESYSVLRDTILFLNERTEILIASRKVKIHKEDQIDMRLLSRTNEDLIMEIIYTATCNKCNYKRHKDTFLQMVTSFEKK